MAASGVTDGKRAKLSRELDGGVAGADEALEAARNLPPGPERSDALKKAGALRYAADADGLKFSRRGRPPR
jgi:hypothetical protein